MTTLEILALTSVIALCSVMIVDYVRDFVNNTGGSGADPWDMRGHGRHINMRHNLKWHLEGIWLVIHANLCYLWHLVRGHNIHYFEDIDPWAGFMGFIMCHECKDSSDGATDVCIWSHNWNWLLRLSQYICSKKGHTFAKPWMKKTEGKFDEDENNVYDTPSDHWHCDRCLADMPAPN